MIVHHRDALVVGSGVAGLSAALSLGSATVITGGRLGATGSTPWSQGGIAAPVGRGDSPMLHARDTVAVSGGIGDAAVAALLTGRAAGRIAWLRNLGARFDRDADGRTALGREAGHSRNRIVHAGGDATGAEVARALTAATLADPGIEVVEEAMAVDLILGDGRVAGLLVQHGGDLVAYLAPAVVLATGGIGRVYARTTNPPEVRGDGLAMAARAGARLADLEFVQFHPTALDADVDPMPLLTEALRGEGAWLVDETGHRFMPSEHPDAELAPRDVVARAVWRRLAGGQRVYLDATAAVGSAFPERFPTVHQAALQAGIDPAVQPMPVSPAAHYHMGGIAVDSAGRSSLPGMWAAGEASSTGVHGANRLASNSLLEGLVFGAEVANSIRRHHPTGRPGRLTIPRSALNDADADLTAIDEIRRVMWERVGLVRNGDGMRQALARLDTLRRRAERSPAGRNLAAVAGLVTAAALARRESRGGHYRADHPQPDPAAARRSFVDPEPAPRVGLNLGVPVRAAS